MPGPDVSQLPPDRLKELIDVWKQAEAPGTGKTYYFHKETRETRWALPDDVVAAQNELKRREASAQKRPEPESFVHPSRLPQNRQPQQTGPQQRPRNDAQHEEPTTKRPTTRPAPVKRVPPNYIALGILKTALVADLDKLLETDAEMLTCKTTPPGIIALDTWQAMSAHSSVRTNLLQSWHKVQTARRELMTSGAVVDRGAGEGRPRAGRVGAGELENLLRSMPDITKSTKWSDIKSTLMADPRVSALGMSDNELMRSFLLHTDRLYQEANMGARKAAAAIGSKRVRV